MELILRLLGTQLIIHLGAVEKDEEDSIVHLSMADTTFGFAPDPVFPEIDWEEEEE